MALRCFEWLVYIHFLNMSLGVFLQGWGTGNAGRPCTVIIGHKEIEGIQKSRCFRDLEEFSGSSVEILPEDMAFSCLGMIEK